MPRFIRRAAMAIVVAGLAAAFSGSAFAAGEARRVTGAEAREALAKGTAVLVDVRVKAAYVAEHAKGAISIPLTELPTRMSELPKDKLIIAYCT